MSNETPCTDAGNSERFVAQHGDKVMYLVEEKRWIAFDGTRWGSKNAKIYGRAIKTARDIIYKESKACKPGDAREGELINWGKRSQSRPRIEAMLTFASEQLAGSIEEFDADPSLINCVNGVLNLRTGKLSEHSPTQKAMKRANVRYVPDAKTELWDTFLKDVFQNDDKLIASVLRILGYCLTGEIKEQHGFIAYGLGGNGKTTLFETVLNIIGDYGTTTTFSAFLKRKSQGARDLEALGMLKGKRFALASETSNTAQLDEATYKRATGGDTLTGASLYVKSRDFEPTHKLILQCNHLPTVKDASHSFWRRPLVIPFKATFDKKVDRDVRQKLLKEKEGIFARLVQEAIAYYKDGLGEIAPAILEATNEWREENDVLSRFIAECMEKEYGSQIPLEKEAYSKYKLWCFDAGEYASSVGNFSKNLKERGIHVKKTNKGNVVMNYRLKRGFESPFEKVNGAHQEQPRLAPKPAIEF